MNKDELHKQQLDDLLAKFTDEVLSGEHEAAIEENTGDDEIIELQKTVILLKSAAEKARTKSDERAQIRSRLMMEWKKTQQAKQSTPSRWNWNWSLPRFALAGGFAVLVLISVVALLTPSTSPLTATSDGSGSWTPFFVIAGIMIVLFIIWRNRHD